MKRYRIKIDKSGLYLVQTKVWFWWQTFAICKYPEIAQKEIEDLNESLSYAIVEVAIGRNSNKEGFFE